MVLEKDVMVTAKMSTTWHSNQLSFVSRKCPQCSICVYCTIQDHPRNFGKKGYFSLGVISTDWW